MGFERFRLVVSPDRQGDPELLLLLRSFDVHESAQAAFDVDDQRCWDGTRPTECPASWYLVKKRVQEQLGISWHDGSLSLVEMWLVSANLSLLLEQAAAAAVEGQESVDPPMRVLEYRPSWEAFRARGFFKDLYLVHWSGSRHSSWESSGFAREHPRQCAAAVQRWLEPIHDGAMSTSVAPSTCSETELPSSDPLTPTEAQDLHVMRERRHLCLSVVSRWLAENEVSVMTWGKTFWAGVEKRLELTCTSYRDELCLWSRDEEKKIELDALLRQGTHLSSRVRARRKRRRA